MQQIYNLYIELIQLFVSLFSRPVFFLPVIASLLIVFIYSIFHSFTSRS